MSRNRGGGLVVLVRGPRKNSSLAQAEFSRALELSAELAELGIRYAE